MNNTYKNLMPLVLISASLSGCMMLFDPEVRPEAASVTEAQEAVLADNLTKFQELAATNPGLIRTRDHARQQTPLHWASSVGDQDVVAWLLEQNVDVDAKDGNGNTPLHVAAFAGRSQVAASLLDRGAQVNARNDYGYTPLAMAARNRQLETAELLVGRGAKIDCGPSGTELIARFAQYGDKEGVEWALSKGAATTGKIGRTDSTGAKIGGENVPGWNALHWLAKGASVSKREAVAANLAHGDDGTEERSVKQVEDAKYLEVFQLLVANGVAVNARDQNKETPLHVAAESNNLVVATALLDAGAEIEPKDVFDGTPLRSAAECVDMHNPNSSCADIVRLLVARGADVNTKDRSGFSPLIAAINWGSREAEVRRVAEIIIAAGVDMNAKRPAVRLWSAGSDYETALTYAAEKGYVSVVDLLIRNGADVNLAFPDGRTPLYCAAQSGHSDVVALLIAHGANVNAEAKGRTALQAARKRGNQGIIDLLLEHGAKE
jgi:ankyrin repeat protein